MNIKKSVFLFLLLIIFFFAGCDRQDANGNSAPVTTTPRAIFAVTDAPHDELAVLQVELTELKAIDTEGNEVVIFSEAEGETFVLNLLELQDINELLGSAELPAGLYKEFSISYKNATALDNDGNVLTIRPQHYGTAKLVLSEPVIMAEDNLFLQIEFDLNNSVYEIVSGPQGSIMLMPTLVLKVSTEDTEVELEEFKGIVQSVSTLSMVMTVNENPESDTINVELTDTTIVEVDDILALPSFPDFDLSDLIAVGNLVEVKGTLDVTTNTVTATKIERKFENHGLESQGLIVALGDGVDTFDLLVLNARDSGFELGSVQTITYDDNTLYLYTNVLESGSAEQLALGQEVRVTGLSDDAAYAQKIKLRCTKLEGTVASINAGSGQITMNVATIEGIAVENIPGFTNPVTVEFDGEFPTEAAVDDEIKVCGHFNRVTQDVFTALEYDLPEEEEELDGDDEDGETTVVGKTFSVISSSPMQLSITRGGDGGNVESRTITVELAAGGVITEKDRSVSTQITSSALVEGINSGKYDKLKAHGDYDSANQLLTATKIVAEVKKK